MKSTFIFAVVACALIYTPLATAGFFDEIQGKLAAAFDFSKQKLDNYHSVEDKQLVDQFYTISEDGKAEGISKEVNPRNTVELSKLSSSTLTIRRLLYKGLEMAEVMGAMRGYSDSPLDDEVGQRYIAFASSRGNVVKMFKPALGGMINSMFQQNFQLKHDRNTSESMGLDNALIEYAPSGRIVSIMTRAHQAVYNFNARSYQYTNFYFGTKLMQYVENKIANHFFDDNFQRIVTASSGEVTPAVIPQASPLIQAASNPSFVPASVQITPTPMTTTAAAVTTTVSTPEHRIQMLKSLVELRKSGALTEQEFSVEKQKVLAN